MSKKELPVNFEILTVSDFDAEGRIQSKTLTISQLRGLVALARTQGIDLDMVAANEGGKCMYCTAPR